MLRRVPLCAVQVRQASAGREHSLFVCAAGQLYSFGEGRGAGSAMATTTTGAPPSLLRRCRCVRREEASSKCRQAATTASSWQRPRLLAWLCTASWGWHGEDTPEPTEVDGGLVADGPAVQVAAGNQFTIVELASGLLHAFGWNAQGQLGLGTGQAAARHRPRRPAAVLGAVLGASRSVDGALVVRVAALSPGSKAASGRRRRCGLSIDTGLDTSYSCTAYSTVQRTETTRAV